MQLNNTVILTGACGGIGRAIATLLADAGYDVALVCHLTSASDATAFISSLSGFGHKLFRCDLRKEIEVRAVIDDIVKSMPPIKACIHAAVDPVLRKRLNDCSVEEFVAQFATGVFGGFRLFQLVFPHILQNGHIIAITSSAADPGETAPRMGAYVAAKYALRGLLRELSREFVSHSVYVNAVAPGFIPTNLHHDLAPAIQERLAISKSGGKAQTPTDVAQMVLKILSVDVTGRSYSVDGSSMPL